MRPERVFNPQMCFLSSLDPEPYDGSGRRNKTLPVILLSSSTSCVPMLPFIDAVERLHQLTVAIVSDSEIPKRPVDGVQIKRLRVEAAADPG